MDIAKAVGAERLREIMAGLLDRATAVVSRYGGTVDKFTGDGIMAVFGAPVALEDHAVRACRAALDIHTAITDLADEAEQRDDVQLRLRIGLNSGQVIAGEVGSGGAGYTSIGEQVGLAQRMESAAPPGGAIMSASTARLVENVASLGDPELVEIKDSDQPVTARRLLGVSDRDRPVAVAESALVGRRWEMGAVEGLLERAMEGHGAVLTVVGSPGIGKSRLVREVTALAAAQGVEVFSAYCESHTSQVPFHVVARLLRSAAGVEGLDPEEARTRLRGLNSDSDTEDVLLFEDLMGIADPEVELPKIDPDARRRRLTAVVNTASLARTSPAVYVVEDAHWIDEVSELMLADFFSVIPQTPSLVLVSYRPEYSGPLSRVQGAQSIALAPLSDRETAALAVELVGGDPSVTQLATLIVERAAGNPFFAQETVRDLVERGVLQGQSGSYVSTADVAEVSLPATVQATIAARIDRLEPAGKRTLSAAAVVGAKVSRDLLESLGIDPAFDDLVSGQFLDQIRFSRDPAYVFHHPLIRTVAYESQLRSDRAELHRRLATVIEARAPASADENAALIAEHLEAAGDLDAAYGWHMRAGNWSMNRDIAAARLSWDRATRVADALPAETLDRAAKRIAPRTLWCASVWRGVPQAVSRRFEEVRQLCTEAGDTTSLAIAMTGLLSDQNFQRGPGQGELQLAAEQMALAESIEDPALRLGAAWSAIALRSLAGDMADVLRWAQTAIEWADGDPAKGNLVVGSPLAVALAFRAAGRWWLGRPGWRHDIGEAMAIARNSDATTLSFVVAWRNLALQGGVLRVEDSLVNDLEHALRTAEASGDDYALGMAKFVLGGVLDYRGFAGDRDRYLTLLAEVRQMCLQQRFPRSELPLIDLLVAHDSARNGDRDGAIPAMRQVAHDFIVNSRFIYSLQATPYLVGALLDRGDDGDLTEAQAAIDRLAGVSGHGWVARDIMVLRLRTLLAHARGDDVTYRDFRDRYRKMANDLGFEGHMQWAEEMP